MRSRSQMSIAPTEWPIPVKVSVQKKTWIWNVRALHSFLLTTGVYVSYVNNILTKRCDGDNYFPRYLKFNVDGTVTYKTKYSNGVWLNPTNSDAVGCTPGVSSSDLSFTTVSTFRKVGGVSGAASLVPTMLPLMLIAIFISLLWYHNDIWLTQSQYDAFYGKFSRLTFIIETHSETESQWIDCVLKKK